MLRVVIVNLAMFLLPFLIYAAWIYLTRRGADRRKGLNDAPIFWLLAIGAVMVIATIGTLISFSGSDSEGIYHAPEVLEDGTIKPGYFEEKPAS